MLIDHILGNINDEKFKNYPMDIVNIEWYDSKKKIHRLTSHKGRDVAVRLSDKEQQRGLWYGDVLAVADDIDAIVVEIIPSKCLTVSCHSKLEIITLCYETGNRHAPFYYLPDNEEFIIPYDHPFEELLKKLHISFVIENRRLDNHWRIGGSTVHNHHHTAETTNE
ncbi:urease accessory protein UreE [Pectinatus frisingensis]|jgi:urease accessory protein|uniref:urease accessory protein UreE n=1 Tax=Pectinatus frisingensis TaxID=865 RepID=UPI0018C4F8E7|nr:urease accessory protein UreE [Pectinatus frisingensis]